MIESAGLLIIQDNKMLLAHPTRAPWYGTYTIPKGKVEEGETYLNAALRETKEEVGVDININDINPDYRVINYTDSRNRIYKKVIYFIVKPSIPINVDKTNIDKKEVNWVGFVDKDDAMDRIFWRFAEMMDYLD
jgi:ADP-ribose pyrophosphatase YjhB (NUDIX family)